MAALVATGVLAVALSAAPAGADAPVPRTVEGPGLAYVRLSADASATAAPLTDATAAATFAAPPNEDFRFSFGAGVSTAKRQVFEAAAGVWSSVLEVEVPVHVSVTVQTFSDPGILGGAAPTELVADDPALPTVGTWYVTALANQFLGKDANPAVPEIDVVLADHPFDESLDPARAEPGRISLLTLALHELGHGLGHTTLALRRPDGTGSVRYQGLPLAYDRHIADAAGAPLTGLAQDALGRAITERLVWTGVEGIRADGGFLPELFAPRSFQPGSSVSHLDEATYGGDLMTPYIAPGEFRSAVPALTEAMMADFGWGLEARTSQEQVVTAMTRDFVRRFPTPTEMRELGGRLRAGTETRRSLAHRFAYSDEWIEAVLDGHYLTTLGRTADQGGLAHWTAALRSGTPAATVAANFYASAEFFRRSGSANAAWVAALYRGILGREPDAAGWSSWTAAADAGTPRLAIAAGFFQTPESRSSRVRTLYRDLLGRDPDAAGLAHWTEILRNGRDIDLAVELAASDEYEGRADRRFG